MTEVEKAHIKMILNESKGKIAGPGGAAERLGINPSTLRSRMKKLGILPLKQ
ncbi:MAG: helix-turn-helix domain-containing protein [Candidatus Auribacterota bacterium]|nr:helix-turn-helix domain-containing protein [Candidatus Auribacterota bacterium]